MPSVLAPPAAAQEQRQPRVPTPVKRFGYLIAAAANAVLLWVAHQLLDWGWPGFLTTDFELVLGVVTASLVTSIVVNLALVIDQRARLRALADLVTAAFAMAVGLRMWEVFPFDFSGYENDWSGLAHVALIAGIAATGIAMVANLVKLVAGPDADV